MDIAALATVLAVANRGSFAAVARERGVDPSSISRTVAGIEDTLGLRIFHRSTRRVSLTEEGRHYLVRLAPLLEGLDEAAASAKALGKAPSGTVRIGCSVAYGTIRLAPLLATFQTQHPDLSFELVMDDSPRDLIADGVDITIRLGSSVSGDVICRRLHPTRYRVCATPGWRDTLTDPSDLAQTPVLRLTFPEFRDAWQIKSNTGDPHSIPVTGQFTFSNPLAMRAACLTGLGPALLADWIIQDDLAAGRLVDLWPTHRFAASSFDTAAWVLYPSRRHLPARVRATLDLIQHYLG